MKFNFFLKSIIFGLSILLFASCDKDYNEVGAGIVGDDHYGLNLDEASSVVAYNQNIGPFQSNDLPINSLGYYNNPYFGKTKASFVSQVELLTANPTFYDIPNIVVDSVYLYVPYYSTVESTDTETGDSVYTLDSIQGSNTIKLNVYESNYYLRNYDPTTGFQQPQKYYSNQKAIFDAAHGATRLNDDDRNIIDTTVVDNSQNDKFVFSEKQIKFYKNTDTGAPGNTTVRERLAPGMFLKLNKAFFKNKIINAPAGKLENNNTFRDYFRGLYFQVENSATSVNQGSLAKLNFAQGKITMIYRDNTSATVTTKIKKTLEIKLGGHTVNLFENEFVSPVTSPNTSVGDSKLYLKGGEGSMAVVELFGGDTNNSDDANTSELAKMRANGWLINEASLSFTIDNTTLGTTAPEPNRIFLYDLNNKRPIVDYYSDFTTSASPKYNKYIHGGIIKKDANGRGTTYTIKITNHVRNLVKYGGTAVSKDSTNVRLGLVVTENIGNALNTYLLNPFTTGTIQNKYFPVMAAVNPLGTVLFGTGPTSTNLPDNKKIKLKIYYTKPN